MNTKNTIAIVLVALALGVYFLVFETDLFDRQLATTREQAARLGNQPPGSGEPLPDAVRWAEDDIRRIRIDEHDRPAVEIERPGEDADQWVQTQPVRFALRPGRVRDLVADALGLRYTSTIHPGEGGMSLEELGLNPPRAVVTLAGEESEPRTLALGRRTGAGRAYLMLGDPAEAGESPVVYVVGDDLHRAVLDTDPRELRSRSLASISPGGVRTIRLTREGETIELQRRDGRWMLTEPVTGRADRAAAEELIRVIGGSTVGRFVEDHPENLAPFSLDDPSIVLKLEAVESVAADPANENAEPDEVIATYELKIGGPTDLERSGYFAMLGDAPVVFTLPESAVAPLEKQIDGLRDPELTPVARSDVKEVAIERSGTEPLHFLRDEGVWAFDESGPDFAIDTGAMENLMGAIFDTRADAYLDLSDHDLQTPAATVELAVVARDEPERLTVYEHEEEDDRMVVIRDGESTGYLVDRAKLEPLFEQALAYRDRAIWGLPEDAVAELRLTRDGPYPAEYHLTREAPAETDGAEDADDPEAAASPGEWALEGFDEEAVRALIDRLTPLLAERWLAKKPDTSSSGQIVIHLTGTDGTEHEVRIDPETRAAQAAGMDTPFEVSRALTGAATAELRDKTLLRLDIARIASIDTDGLTVRRDEDGRFSASGGDDAELDEQKAAALFNAMAGLTAVRFVDPARAAADPAATLTLTTTDDQTHTLKLWTPGDGEAIGQLDGKTFTLTPETAENLTAL